MAKGFDYDELDPTTSKNDIVRCIPAHEITRVSYKKPK